jgi:uncharacterized membrane protein (UPF0127 family)
MNATNSTQNRELSRHLTVADNIFSRLKGLLGKKSLADGEGLLIGPCKGIHTFGMQFPIDALFLDRDNCVLAAIGDLRPNRLTRIYPGASCVIELPAGTIASTATGTGDRIDIH